MTPPARQDGAAPARFDRVYDLYRNCLLNQAYYGHRLASFTRLAFWLEIVIVVGSGASGVSGWIIWTRYPTSGALWAAIAALSTVLAAVKPVLQTDAKLKRYSTLFAAYRQLSLGMQTVVDDIAEAEGIPRETEREVGRIRDRYRSLSADDDPIPSRRLVARLQEEINTKVPPTSLFYPPDSVVAPDASAVTEAPAHRRNPMALAPGGGGSRV